MSDTQSVSTRRQFVTHASAAAMALSRTAPRQDDAGAPARTWSPGPYLFLDLALVAESVQLQREVTPFAREPEPVITGREDGCFQPWVTVIRDPVTRRFRVWYDTPRSPGNAGESSIATMESEDGLHWLRPHRVLRDPAPIQYGASVIDEGPRYPDPARRYKLAWWKNGGMQVAASSDGLNWRPLADGVVLRTNHDITGIDWDPIRRRYIAFVSQVSASGRYRGLRIPHQSVSDDLVHWRAPWPIVTPDPGAAIERGETQFYGMSALLPRGELLVSFVKVLRDDLNCEADKTAAELHDRDRPFAGIGYTVAAWSSDGVTWRRETTPSLDRNSTPGTWDRAMAWADDQLLIDDRVRLYYGGYRWGHKAERFTGRQIGVAHLPRDRYVGYVAGDAEGWMRTSYRTLGAVRRITVNAAVAPGGDLRARLVGADGRAVDGFDWHDCGPLAGDRVRIPVAFRGRLAAIAGRPARLEFRLRRARLYSFDLA